MKKLTPIQRLDKVLNIMQPSNDNPATAFKRPDIIAILKSSFDFTDKEADEISNQLPQILDKLVRDEYITFDLDRYNRDNEKLNGAAFKYFIITFEGELFNFAGGYMEKKRKDIRATNLQSLQTWAIVIGTFFAGVYGLYEMIKAICNLF